jgi:hypothetical protein
MGIEGHSDKISQYANMNLKIKKTKLESVIEFPFYASRIRPG